MKRKTKREYLSDTNVADNYYTEPVFSVQAIYGFPHQPQTYDCDKKRD